jgi:hypoxanthine-guanine phosphoribosyltransferase
MELRILHITDFHIDNPHGESENLRDGFYREFIDKLVAQIGQNFPGGIDYIMATGDFVNRGKVENFGHASKVLQYLADGLKVPKGKVAICLGNHDYNRDVEKEQGPIIARKPYYDFASQFDFGEEKKKNDNASLLFEPSKKAYLLRLDSTWHSEGTAEPGKLSTKEIDDIINQMVYDVPKDELLVILSHFPMISFPRAKYVTEEKNWEEKHIWKDSNDIVERIVGIRPNSQTLYLFGDGHIPDFTSYSEYAHFIMTGMIGGSYDSRHFINEEGQPVSYNKTDEVKIIEFTSEANQPYIYTLSYKPDGYTFSKHKGHWEINKSPARIEASPKAKPQPPEEQIRIIPEKFDLSTEVISTSVQTEIIERIRNGKLYSLNRHVTSETDVSLGWVSINKLFDNQQILVQCIEKSIDWLSRKITSPLNENNTILIGVDFWGSILASQISVRTKIKNFCFAVRGEGKHNSHQETIEFLKEQITLFPDLKNIIILTDVVSSGNTINKTREKLAEFVKPITIENWVAISIISDAKQARSVEINKFKYIGTFCGELRIPMVNSNDLPDESILPPRLDFR